MCSYPVHYWIIFLLSFRNCLSFVYNCCGLSLFSHLRFNSIFLYRKANLRELKVLQREEQKQGMLLMAKIRRQWDAQEQRFEQELVVSCHWLTVMHAFKTMVALSSHPGWQRLFSRARTRRKHVSDIFIIQDVSHSLNSFRSRNTREKPLLPRVLPS